VWVLAWQGYPLLRDFLRDGGIRHVIMMGYAADMCLISTTAGYQNVSKDFNCFVVGDATLATFPANDSPAHATVRSILSCLSLRRTTENN
jgi:nicotinamidase-related amidase